MIRLNGVNKYFNKRKANEIHAIDNTTLELGNTGLVTFLGNSGCGKTTLLNAIGGLDKVDSGDIEIDGEKITCRSDSKRDNIRNAKIGYIFQNYNLIDNMTVFDNVAIPLRMMGVKDREEIEKRVTYVLEKTGIERYKYRPASMLSGGERQRVGIARAIVKNPEVIIADEPTGNLDSENTLEIMNLIKAVSKEKLVILVTHEKNIAEFYADRIIRIVDGKIVSDEINDVSEGLDVRSDSKIYLQDMPVIKKSGNNGVNIEYYSDSNEDITIKVILKNNNLYIQSEPSHPMGPESNRIIDGHYEALSKEEVERYNFDFKKLESIKTKYTSIYTPGKSIAAGFKTIFGYSKLKKALLVTILIVSMVVLGSISHIAGIKQVKDEKFMKTHRDYITVETGKLSPEKMKKYGDMDNVSYIIPGSSGVYFTAEIGKFIQTAGSTTVLSGSLSSTDRLSKEELTSGRLPENDYEIVVDEMALKDMLKTDMTAAQNGIKKPSDLVGAEATLPFMDSFRIVGTVKSGNPSIYVKKDMILPVAVYGNTKPDSMADDSEKKPVFCYDYLKNRSDIKVIKGHLPEKDGEVLISENLQYEYSIGKPYNLKVGDRKLIVSGYYHDRKGRNLNIVNRETWLEDSLPSFKELTIVPVQGKKDLVLKELENSKFKVTDKYSEERNAYLAETRNQVKTALISSGVLLAISFIEILLILRASFLSRIKEVGILRAIGLKKHDIYNMFIGETVALNLVTTLPGTALMTYILSNMVNMQAFRDKYLLNPEIVIGSFLLLFVFNIIAGILPVMIVIRKTPAEILARNDVQ